MEYFRLLVSRRFWLNAVKSLNSPRNRGARIACPDVDQERTNFAQVNGKNYRKVAIECHQPAESVIVVGPRCTSLGLFEEIVIIDQLKECSVIGILDRVAGQSVFCLTRGSAKFWYEQ